MNLLKKRFNRGKMKGSLVKRVFLIFLLCTMLPLCALAYFSIFHVSAELERQAGERLHQECKSAGMTVLERLIFLETDLHIVITEISDRSGRGLETAVQHLGDRYEIRFSGMSLVSSQGEVTESVGEPIQPPVLDGDQKAHLGTEKTAVLVVPRPPAFSRIFLAKALDPKDDAAGILLAAVHPNYLWDDDEFQGSDIDFMAYHPDSNSVLHFYGIGEPPITELEVAMKKYLSSGQFRYECGEETYVAGYRNIFMKHRFLTAWVIIQGQPQAHILAPLTNFEHAFLSVVVLSFLAVLLISIHQIRKKLVPVKVLQNATEQIASKDFSSRVDIRTGDEFETLGKAFNQMSESMEEYDRVMTTMIQIGISLSGEQQLDSFFQTILHSARRIVRSDGASLYMLNEDDQLILTLRHVESLDARKEDASGISLSAPIMAQGFYSKTVANLAVAHGETVNLPDVYAAKEYDFTETFALDERYGYRTQSVLSVPLKDHNGRNLGVLELFNAIDKQTGELTFFTEENARLVESLASQAAVTLIKNRLMDEFKGFFESLIELIATAIDEKSDYTGGHCRRVPVLAKMIADAACESKEGPLKNFRMSKAEFYELNVAALLHDCGKVVTPVHVVDKKTRLETIFDRIEILKTRFEILKRDAEIALLRKHGTDTPDEEVVRRRKEIEQDLAFLRICNETHKNLSEDHVDGVRKIAEKYKWRDGSGQEKPILSEEEVRNLTIQRGTLNEEERRIVENHVVTTINMLESLPYPSELMNVPHIAGSHHERMDGKGYPKGLKGEEMSIRSKILCIADIFEALTAPDRPYRPPKTMSEALLILREMADNGHIDKDLFEVFVDKEVYMLYAKDHMKSWQIDMVDPSKDLEYDPTPVQTS